MQQGSRSADNDDVMRTLALYGVDDLAKYRIANYLVNSPRLLSSVGHVAEELGFRSVSRTQTALDELVRAGLLRVRVDKRQRTWYGLREDAAARLIAAGAFAPGHGPTAPDLRVLAKRSLARVRSPRRSTPPRPRGLPA